MRSTLSYLKQQDFTLLITDKEGAFVVMTNAAYSSKACEAINKIFESRNDVSLSKVKLTAKTNKQTNKTPRTNRVDKIFAEYKEKRSWQPDDALHGKNP